MRYGLALILVVLPQITSAQTFRTSAAEGIVGTYREHDRLGAGCTIEAGEPKQDSVRVQYDCNRGAPSYHHGADDVRVALHHGVATYASRNDNGSCTIRFEFGRARVTVTQTGSDLACGFGAFVKIDGTYPRVSRRPPRFDLLPL